jgi:HSP20 family molecular chaperone IbpA
MVLPSSLFEQARKGNKIFFSQKEPCNKKETFFNLELEASVIQKDRKIIYSGNKKECAGYIFDITPFITVKTNLTKEVDEDLKNIRKLIHEYNIKNRSDLKNFSKNYNQKITAPFDQCVKSISQSGKTTPFDQCVQFISQSGKKDFYSIVDVPDKDYHTIYLRSLEKIEDPQKTGSVIRRMEGAELYSFSSETKHIRLGLAGAQSLDPTQLRLFDFTRSRDIMDTIPVTIREDELGLNLQFPCPGCSDSDIEILVDQGDIYIMMDQTKASCKALEDSQFFYHGNLKSLLRNKSKELNEKGISAINLGCGILHVYVPFISSSPAKVIANNIPLKKMIDCTVTWDVGLGNTFGACCDPLWEQAPLSFTWTEGNKWKGEIPVGKTFKFVKLSEGKVPAWEQGGDRIFNEDFYNDLQGSTVTLSAENVKF